jgi:protein-S-isoprenylcysteine O-methyltransferase Ste14
VGKAEVVVGLGRIFISPEEKMREESFGDAFKAYRERMWRWL